MIINDRKNTLTEERKVNAIHRILFKTIYKKKTDIGELSICRNIEYFMRWETIVILNRLICQRMHV